MKLPDFPLAPWEVPPNSDIALVAPADHVFDAVWRGRETQIWVRQIHTPVADGVRTYFRDGNSDEVGNWLTSTNQFSPELLQKLLRHKGFWRSDLNARRQFYLDGAPYGCPSPIELRIARERGSWRLGRQVTYFQVPAWITKEFASQRAANVGRLAKRWLCQHDSEIRFALQWTHLSDLEKTARVFGVSPNEREDIETLLHHGFQFYLHNNSAHFDGAIFVYWRVHHTEPEEAQYLIGFRRTGEFGVETPDFLRGWRELLWRYYRVNPDRQLAQWCKESSQPTCNFIDILMERVTDFTAHERMETQLVLRDWCRDAGLLDQFETLLQTLRS